MNPLYRTKVKAYEYLKRSEFRGVSGTPAPVGSPKDWWDYRWVGIHPKTPYLEHTITISPRFDRLFANASHQIKVEVLRIGGDRKLLYAAQLDLSGVGEINEVAQQLTIALTLFLLKLNDPAKVHGVCDLCHSSQVSRWSIALRETINGICKSTAEEISLRL
jgi:hypothetical protein